MQGQIYVLVSGSLHDAGLWEPVASRLKAEGHEVHVPTTRNAGPGSIHAAATVDCVAGVVAYVQSRDIRNIILLGHRHCAVAMRSIARELRGRIRAMLVHDASSPAPDDAGQEPGHRNPVFSLLSGVEPHLDSASQASFFNEQFFSVDISSSRRGSFVQASAPQLYEASHCRRDYHGGSDCPTLAPP